MDIEAFIKNAGDNGWEFFRDTLRGPSERAPGLSPEQLAKTQQLMFDAASVYATDQGRRLIDHLCEITLYRVGFASMLGLPMDQAYGHGCHREGQNAIVFTLLKMIAEGRKEKQPAERTTA